MYTQRTMVLRPSRRGLRPPLPALGLFVVVLAIAPGVSAAPEDAPDAVQSELAQAEDFDDASPDEPRASDEAETRRADPQRDARIRVLEQNLRAAQQAIGVMQAELDALKQGEPSVLPQLRQPGAAPTPAPSDQPPAPAPPRTAGPRTAPAEPGPSEDYAVTEEAPSPAQELPEFTPGFLRETRAVLIREGLLELDSRIAYQHNGANILNIAGLDIIESIFIGRFEVGKVKRDVLRPAIALRYGWTNRLQFNMEIPYVHTWERRFLPPNVQRIPARGRETETDNGGLGDITFGLSYHLWRESRLLPDVILTTSIKSDTGDGPFDVGAREATTGTGFWGATAGVSLLKVTDPGAMFANFGYFYHHQDSIGSTKIDPPDAFEWGLGYSWALNPFLSLTTRVNGRFVDKTEVNGSRLAGSEQTIANLQLGLTYAFGENRSFDTAIGLGLTEDSSDFSIVFSMPFTFHVGNIFEHIF